MLMRKSIIVLSSALAVIMCCAGYYFWSMNHVDRVNLDNVTVCFGCHGKSGDIAYEGSPLLAGKDRAYLLAQLQVIQKGQRDVPVMEGILTNYSRRQLLEAAHYYANLPKPTR